MMASTKIFLLISVVLAVGSIEPVQSICKSFEEIDQKCGLEIDFFGNRDLIVPLDEKLFSENCGVYQDGVKCLHNFVDQCVTGKPKDMSKMILSEIDAHYSKRCQDGGLRASFIQHNQCFKDGGILEKFHRCADRFHYIESKIRGTFKEDLYIPTACCTFHQFQDCIVDKNKNLCHDGDGRYWIDALDDMSDKSVVNFCKGYDTTEICSKNLPPEWKKLNDEANALSVDDMKKQIKFRSMFFTFLNIFNGFKN